jgi:hypothetical protein
VCDFAYVCCAAERALDALNYTDVNGKPIRIMWSHRDPAFRKSGVGNIFIKVRETVGSSKRRRSGKQQQEAAADTAGRSGEQQQQQMQQMQKAAARRRSRCRGGRHQQQSSTSAAVAHISSGAHSSS